MDNEKYIRIIDNEPNGLLIKLKYYEYEVEKLSDNESEIRERLLNKIDNLQKDLSVYDDIWTSRAEDISTSIQKIEGTNEELMELKTSFIERLPIAEIVMWAILICISIPIAISFYLNSSYVQTFLTVIIMGLTIALIFKYLRPLKWIREILNESSNILEVSASHATIMEELKKEIFFAKKRNQKNDNKSIIGNHSENREWLETHFSQLKKGDLKIEQLADGEILSEVREITGEHGSDNLLAKQLAVIYKYEFNRPISHDQIKGMVIYNNR